MILCEHASNYIPTEYEGLGLTGHDLERHIAWDPGAAAVARQLSDLLGATAFLGSYSRLLIDLNRPLDSAGSMVLRSEDSDIPGNMALDAKETERRQRLIFDPFHKAVSDCLDQRKLSGQPTCLISIHSFTPVYLGVSRSWHAGVLFENAVAFGDHLIARMRRPDISVGANVPYKTDRAEDYSVPIHGDDRHIPAVLIEIRNDLIATPRGIDDWARHLAVAIHGVIMDFPSVTA